MESFLRVAGCLSLVAVLAVGVACAQPQWLADLGLDFWHLPELDRYLAASQHKSTQLEQKWQQIQKCADQKTHIVQQLIAEKISLAKAAAEITALCDEELLQFSFRSLEIVGASEQERVCRLLIFWTDNSLSRDPGQAELVHTRLETELQELLGITL